jgi:uncharacterized protein YlxW (UPF0749 family)
MKKIFFLIVILLSLNFTSCSNIEPIVSDVCDITMEICNYAELLCSTFNPKMFTEKEQQELKQELMKVKDILQSKVSEMEKESMLKKNYKNNYTNLINRLKNSVNEIDSVIESDIETANN